MADPKNPFASFMRPDEPYRRPAQPSGLRHPRPNLVIFMPDQLRYDSLGCSGNPEVRTPYIDAFAAESVRFKNCYLQATVCSQSRYSIYTGTYPHVSGHRSLENLIKPWEPNMFRRLKESGYHVACLAPRGDTFAPTVTELSLSEYGFLETPEFAPRFPDKSSASGEPSTEANTTAPPKTSGPAPSTKVSAGLKKPSTTTKQPCGPP